MLSFKARYLKSLLTIPVQFPLLSFQGLYSVTLYLPFKYNVGKNIYCFIRKKVSSPRTESIAYFVHNTGTILCDNQLYFVSELNWARVIKNCALDPQESSATFYMKLMVVTPVDS